MGADPDYFIEKKLSKTSRPELLDPPRSPSTALPPQPRDHPRHVRGLSRHHGVDLGVDNADFAQGRGISCPVLLLWGATGGVGRNHKSMEIWPRYAADIRAGKALPCGHYLSEEAPEETTRALREFFAAP